MDSVPAARSPFLKRMGNALLLGFLRVLAYLPLSWVRGLGWLFGRFLYLVAARRRRIATINWSRCFPDDSDAECEAAVRRHIVLFAQAWLDRSWLWGASQKRLRQRLHLVGNVELLMEDTPTLLFAPHFVGMDAGWTAMTSQLQRRFCGIYARQLNIEVDRWMFEGRQRFGAPRTVAKSGGLKPIVTALRAGEPLYLLPDMDFGPRDSIFVPFFGVVAATVPTLSRISRLTGARVIPVVSKMTRDGYEVRVLAPWADYPGADVAADTARMNAVLQEQIRAMPEQYYWVHKRFKTRPPGEPSFYGRD